MTTKNQKNIIFLVISLGLLGSMLFFAVLPSILKITTIANEINLEIEKLQIKSSKGQSIENDINNLDKIKKSKEISNSFVLKNKEINFIKELENTGEKLNLIQSISVDEMASKIKNKEKIEKIEMPLIIKLQGNYFSLLKYLIFLEKSSYYININFISFGHIGEINSPAIINNFNKNSEDSNKLNLIIKAKTFKIDL